MRFDMPRFSIQIDKVSRRTGASSVRHAAYRAGARLRDERLGRTHDYRGKTDVLHSEILAPREAAGWMHDRSRLWNAVEARERRKDARLAQEIYISVPREIRPDRRIETVREFVRESFVSKGMIADIAIHVPAARDGREDPHAHVMLTTRPIEGDGFGLKAKAWDHPHRVAECRIAWERHANRALARSGCVLRVDRRSLQEQRREAEGNLQWAIDQRDQPAALHYARKAAALDREPEIALGRAASHMQKQGRKSARYRRLTEIRMRNARQQDLRLRKYTRQAMRQLRSLERQDRWNRFRDELAASAIHKLPEPLRRRVYLRRNLRRIAAAQERMAAERVAEQPNRERSSDERTRSEREHEHEQARQRPDRSREADRQRGEERAWPAYAGKSLAAELDGPMNKARHHLERIRRARPGLERQEQVLPRDRPLPANSEEDRLERMRAQRAPEPAPRSLAELLDRTPPTAAPRVRNAEREMELER